MLEPSKLPVTVIVPTKNEETNLSRCLTSLTAFQYVWVVDSGSTDATKEIAQAFGAQVIEFCWSGGFPKKRNWVLINVAFQTEWVLFLDADEHISPEFTAELGAALKNPKPVGYWLNYTTHFMGKILKHGVAQRKLAFFRVGSGLYERIEDPGWTKLDMEVHEHPILKGPVSEITSPITHLDYRGIEHFIARHNAYSSWEANRYFGIKGSQEADLKRLTPRQRIKYASLAKWWFAPAYFVVSYFLKGGVFDGAAGLNYALLKAWYFHSIRLKIMEIKESSLLVSKISIKKSEVIKNS